MYNLLKKHEDETRFKEESWDYANYFLNQDFTKEKNIACYVGNNFNKTEVGAILKKYTYLRIVKNEPEQVLVRLEH